MYRQRGRSSKKLKKSLGQTVIQQIIVCIIIVLLVIMAKKMDIAIVNHAMETFHTQLSKNYTATDMIDTTKTAFSKLKEGSTTIVATLIKGGKMAEFSPPTDGIGSLTASVPGSNGGASVQFKADEEIQVYAASGGTISEIGNGANESQYIQITHGNKIFSLYGGCTEVYVKPLEKVKRGQIIGTVKEGENQFLTFEVWVDGKLADPTDYVQF
jgi:murein DD-endopeptidase MepM/ murein hydrolase activator NlpD